METFSGHDQYMREAATMITIHEVLRILGGTLTRPLRGSQRVKFRSNDRYMTAYKTCPGVPMGDTNVDIPSWLRVTMVTRNGSHVPYTMRGLTNSA